MKGELEEHIRQLAYRLYEERGCEGGHSVDDWLRAEREVRGFASRRGKMDWNQAIPTPRRVEIRTMSATVLSHNRFPRHVH